MSSFRERAGRKARIVIVDDQPLYLIGLRATLEECYDIVGSIGRLSGLLDAVNESRPDLVVVRRLFLGEGSALSVISTAIKKGILRYCILLSSAVNGSADMVAAECDGISGCLGDRITGSDLVQAIEVVLAGGKVFQRADYGELRWRPYQRATVFNVGATSLSVRDAKMLLHLYDGKDYNEIGKAIGLAGRTVEGYIQQLQRAIASGKREILIRWIAERHKELLAIK